MAAKKGEELSSGGYACELTPSSQTRELQTECPICLLILKTPHMISCCGVKFCQTCIQPVLSSKKPCPLCAQTGITSMADKQLERTLRGMKVHCTYRKEGCEWEGDLQDLEKHINQKGSPLKGCALVTVKCSQCQRKYRRKDLESHMTNKCMEVRVSCDFSCVGCQENVTRKNLQKHLQESLAQHLSLLLQHTKFANSSDEIADLTNRLNEMDHRITNEDDVSRKILNSEIAKLKTHTNQQVRSTVWRVSGAFVVALLAILLALALREGGPYSSIVNPRGKKSFSPEQDLDSMISDLTQEVQALKKRLDTFVDTKNSDETDRMRELEAIMKASKAERERLQELATKLDNTAISHQNLYEDIQKLKSNLESTIKELDARSSQEGNEDKMESLRAKLSDLETLPQDLAALKGLLSTLTSKTELEVLKARLETDIAELKGSLQMIQQRLDSLPTLPTLLLKIQAMVEEEVGKLPPPPPPHHPPHPHHHHRHGHGGRGHGHCHRH